MEEKSTDRVECIDSEDQDGLRGVTKEFIVYLARAVKDAQREEKHCYHCSSPDHFICDCPLLVASGMDLHINQKEGMPMKKGAWAPQGKVAMLKVSQDRTPRHKVLNTDSLLESQPLKPMVGD